MRTAASRAQSTAVRRQLRAADRRRTLTLLAHTRALARIRTFTRTQSRVPRIFVATMRAAARTFCAATAAVRVRNVRNVRTGARAQNCAQCERVNRSSHDSAHTRTLRLAATAVAAVAVAIIAATIANRRPRKNEKVFLTQRSNKATIVQSNC